MSVICPPQPEFADFALGSPGSLRFHFTSPSCVEYFLVIQKVLQGCPRRQTSFRPIFIWDHLFSLSMGLCKILRGSVRHVDNDRSAVSGAVDDTVQELIRPLLNCLEFRWVIIIIRGRVSVVEDFAEDVSSILTPHALTTVYGEPEGWIFARTGFQDPRDQFSIVIILTERLTIISRELDRWSSQPS